MLLLGVSLLLFSLLFFFPAILFFQPIMLNILLQAIYYAEDFTQNLATYVTVTSCTISHHMQMLLYKLC